MAELKWKSADDVPTTEIADKFAEMDLSVANLNKIYKEIDACTTIEQLQEHYDRLQKARALKWAFERVLDNIGGRIQSKADLL